MVANVEERPPSGPKYDQMLLPDIIAPILTITPRGANNSPCMYRPYTCMQVHTEGHIGGSCPLFGGENAISSWSGLYVPGGSMDYH